MKIGYPCINTDLPTSNKTFRLKSYSEEKLFDTIQLNIDALYNILNWNKNNNLLYFRIGSNLVPFASHEVCKSNWQKHFQSEFQAIGKFIKENDFRIAMHPGQFSILNSPNENVVNNTIKELEYHCQILNLMELDDTAKVQIHIGGIYNDKQGSIKRFIDIYKTIPQLIKNRLVIENDDKSYSFSDAYYIHSFTGIPIVFDTLHHECINNDEDIFDSINLANKTWQNSDGNLLIDYSSQAPNKKNGAHIQSINSDLFSSFIKNLTVDADIILEIKDKQKSALKALSLFD